jgi:hypothetical protein
VTRYHFNVVRPWCPQAAPQGAVRENAPKLGRNSHALARHKERQILGGHRMLVHVHMCMAIPESVRSLR